MRVSGCGVSDVGLPCIVGCGGMLLAVVVRVCSWLVLVFPHFGRWNRLFGWDSDCFNSEMSV